MHRVILISQNVHHIHSSKKGQPIVINHNRLAFFILLRFYRNWMIKLTLRLTNYLSSAYFQPPPNER